MISRTAHGQINVAIDCMSSPMPQVPGMADRRSTHSVSSGRYVLRNAALHHVSSTSSLICYFSASLQAYLRFVGIDVDVIPSNNHASPSGALPFLIPAHPINNNAPIPSSKLQKWAIEQVHCEEEQQLDLRFEVYASLLDHRIRNAWVRCGPPPPE